MRDHSQMHFKERIAIHDNLQYVNINDTGKIGLICNSAGYALATMDRVSTYGQTCSNFTDLRGNAYYEQLLASLVLLEKCTAVQVILVNMFCGDMSAIDVANTIIDAFKNNYVQKHFIIRIKGQNAIEANLLLQELEAQNKVTLVNDFDCAVQEAVRISN